MATKPYQDPEVLRELYHEKYLSTDEIGERLGCSGRTVRDWMAKHGIETTNSDHKQLDDRDWLYEKYVEEGLTTYDIADIVGCRHGTVWHRLKKYGIETHSQSISTATDHPSFDYHRGYHRATSHLYRDGEQVETRSLRVHRLVAVAEWGFDALEGKHVHHRNGIPWDNRPENLQLVTPEEHRKIHESDEYPETV